MEHIVQIICLVVLSGIGCCMIRPYAPGISTALSIGACVITLLAGVQFLRPMFQVLTRLQTLTKLTDAAVAPMLKVAGIGILTQIAGTVCEDAGEKALHNAVELCGMFMSLYVSVPLLTSVVGLLEEMLTG